MGQAQPMLVNPTRQTRSIRSLESKKDQNEPNFVVHPVSQKSLKSSPKHERKERKKARGIFKLPLPEHPSPIPHRALRSLISNYTNISLPKSQACSEPQAPISILTSQSSSLESKLESLRQLGKPTKGDSALRCRLTEAGVVPVVLRCVDSYDPGLHEKALSLLLNVSLDDDNKVGLVAEGAVNRVVKVLHVGSPDCRAIATTVITSTFHEASFWIKAAD